MNVVRDALPARLSAVLLLLAVGAVPAQSPQQKMPVPLGTLQGTATREQMWRAPTTEDWRRPVLITFQRTWEDAVRVARTTGKPILVCTNMDGEIASEHYAGVRYRQPEIAKVYAPYVCVIASVYRHNPRDYDDRGRRIECPRFGSVTCGEHIWIEPGLFKKYFEDTRVAPRHIMVELADGEAVASEAVGRETYDLYYAFDTRSVFTQLQKGILERRRGLTRQIRERSLLQRVASSEHRDKVMVERAYVEGDKSTKRRILQAVVANPNGAQADLLRLAIYDLDAELNRLARQALAKTDSAVAIDVINEALRASVAPGERDALIANLERLAKYHSRAQTLATVHKGLASQASVIDAKRWAVALAAQPGASEPVQRELAAVESQLEYRAAAIKQSPDDADARLELAAASLALAVNPATSQMLSRDYRTAAKYAQLMFDDARRAARRAEQLGAKGWRLNSILAICNHYLGDDQLAAQRSELAVADLPEGDRSWNSMAVLGIFAEARMAAIKTAIKGKRKWPRQWLTDVHSAYSVLSKHPNGTDAQVVAHYDFLCYLGADRPAARALHDGMKRFPNSGEVHARMRSRLLAEGGVSGLERYYRVRLASDQATAELSWFAGYAAIVAAEFRRRASDNDAALAAYGRAIARFDTAIQQNPKCRSTADHFAAIAIAGRARVKLEMQSYEESVNQLIAAFERKPTAGGSLDGLNQTPMDTAKLLRSSLWQAQKAEQIERLDAAIAKLPAAALELPEYEQAARRDGLWVFRRGKMRRPGWRDRRK